MNKFYKVAFLSLGLLAGSLTCGAQNLGDGEMLFGYYDRHPESLEEGFGSEQPQTYDIAMWIPERYAGSTVKGVKVPLRDTSTTSYMGVWATTELNAPAEGEYMTGNLANKTFECNTDKFTYYDVMFDTPVVVPARGLYIGYTIKVDKCDTEMSKLPVSMVVPKVTGDEMFLCRINGWNFFQDYTYDGMLDEYLTTTMLAIMGDCKVKDQGYFMPEGNAMNFLKGTETLTVPVRNEGWNGVQSIDYIVTINGKTAEGHYDFPADAQVSALRQWGAVSDAEINVPLFEEGGDFAYTLEIAKVNGVDNKSEKRKIEGTLRVYDQLILRTPLIEEGTSTACQYCPRLMYGMEVMERLYPESVRIIYHTADMGYNDPMLALRGLPWTYGGVPDVRIDRVLDPQNPSEKKTCGLEAGWKARLSEPSVATLQGEISWLDKDLTQIRVDLRTQFHSEVKDGSYRLEFALLQDGMKGEGIHWQQKNAYAGAANEYSEPEWAKYGKPSSNGYVSDMVYDNIFVLGGSRTMKGIVGSVPKNIEAEQVVEYTHVFNLKDAQKFKDMVTLEGNLIQDKRKLKVVAILLNGNGEVENCVRLDFSADSIESVGGTGYEREIVGYYDLAGRKVENPQGGIYIVRYSDGTSEKRVLR